MDKVYHIYAKDQVIFHSLKEAEFKKTWQELQGMVGLMKTDYVPEDLSYEEVFNLMESESPSY
tara:strand:- start:1754 stop:1942 length:189 start_codon:yes stop_codon:yes gene_type:complete